MNEIGQEVFKRQTGSAPTFQSIDGVGPKTAEKVKGTIVEGEGRIQAPQDVSDLTDDTLADKAGISKTRARKVIKGAGGNPDREPRRRSTGSVSAAGIKLPQGEFVTEVSDQDKAEAKFSTSRNRGIGRSQNAAIADKGKRAPVTTDYERWKSNKGELDFPGVDTPTDSPDVRPKDLRQDQRPNTTDPEADRQAVERASVDMSAPGNGAFLLEDQSAAGVDGSDIGEEFVSAAGESRDVSLAPDEAFFGVGATSGRSIGGFSGTYGGEESPVSEPEPPEAAIEEQDRLVDRDKRERAAERQDALDPQSDADPFEFSAEGIGESVELFGGDR